MVLVRAGEGQRIESRQSSVEDIRVPAGEAVDIFYRYGQCLMSMSMSDVNWMAIFLLLSGFFSLSVRVVPRDGK